MPLTAPQTPFSPPSPSQMSSSREYSARGHLRGARAVRPIMGRRCAYLEPSTGPVGCGKLVWNLRPRQRRPVCRPAITKLNRGGPRGAKRHFWKTSRAPGRCPEGVRGVPRGRGGGPGARCREGRSGRAGGGSSSLGLTVALVSWGILRAVPSLGGSFRAPSAAPGGLGGSAGAPVPKRAAKLSPKKS